MGLVASALLACQQVPADAGGPADGLAVMQESQRRHDLYPYVFEEQTMVLVDRHGNRNTRKLRRYSRVEADGTVRLLLAFDYPPEIRGSPCWRGSMPPAGWRRASTCPRCPGC